MLILAALCQVGIRDVNIALVLLILVAQSSKVPCWTVACRIFYLPLFAWCYPHIIWQSCHIFKCFVVNSIFVFRIGLNDANIVDLGNFNRLCTVLTAKLWFSFIINRIDLFFKIQGYTRSDVWILILGILLPFTAAFFSIFTRTGFAPWLISSSICTSSIKTSIACSILCIRSGFLVIGPYTFGVLVFWKLGIISWSICTCSGLRLRIFTDTCSKKSFLFQICGPWLLWSRNTDQVLWFLFIELIMNRYLNTPELLVMVIFDSLSLPFEQLFIDISIQVHISALLKLPVDSIELKVF